MVGVYTLTARACPPQLARLSHAQPHAGHMLAQVLAERRRVQMSIQIQRILILTESSAVLFGKVLEVNFKMFFLRSLSCDWLNSSPFKLVCICLVQFSHWRESKHMTDILKISILRPTNYQPLRNIMDLQGDLFSWLEMFAIKTRLV